MPPQKQPATRASSRINPSRHNARPQPTPEGVPLTVHESQGNPRQEPSVQPAQQQQIPAELIDAGIAEPLLEHVTQAFMQILQTKNQLIIDREK